MCLCHCTEERGGEGEGGGGNEYQKRVEYHKDIAEEDEMDGNRNDMKHSHMTLVPIME